MKPITLIRFSLLLPAVIAAAPGTTAPAGDHPVTRPIGHLNEPLATKLDFRTFNPAEGEKTDKNLGEILSLFDEFLEAQGIGHDGTTADLERLHTLISRDYALASSREDILDDQYDDLKDDAEDLAEDLEDWEEDRREGKKKKKKKKPSLSEYLDLKTGADALKEKRNLYRGYIEFEEPVLALLNRARCHPGNERLRKEACHVAIRNLYSIFSDQFLGKKDFDPYDRTKREKNLVIKAFVFRAQKNSTRFYDPKERGCRVGPFAAKKEATNLVDPDCPDRFMEPAQLAKLSHEEVSQLDISPTNPMWHTHSRMEHRPDTWSHVENWIENEVSKELLDKKKFEKEFPGFRYRLYAARRVLFWEDVKVTATSPKIDTIDAFDQEWKLKWGEESVIEPVANRLRLLAGSRYTDLTYANVGGSSHLLILPSALQKSMNPDKVMPLTRADFVREMKTSKYDFNVEPFILSSGVITEDNADTILAGLPEEALKPFRKKRLIGRTWIRFRESMVEAKHDVVNSGGPITTDSVVATRDRALRQSMIAAFWMADVDVKEDNHRGVWTKNFAGQGGDQYMEFFHDPGSSLGGARRSGEVNRLNYDYATGGFLWLNPLSISLYSDSFQIYRPGAWSHTTFADQLSGVRHLARITKAEICEAIQHSHMPDFYQESLAWRLIKRRDLIAKVYDVPLRDGPAGAPPTIAVPLTTRSNRAAAAARYHVPLAEIENDLVRTGHLDGNHRSGNTIEPFVDILAEKATITPYHETVLSGIIRDFRHPSGFIERMNRFNDGEEWQSKRFGTEQ
ncbi:MAG: hypothetical protein P1U68_08595 [Verrucomicrobiales bacterium]|nr:hypothetical protein [Verrucomicrobiales bacterium]